MNHKRTIFDVPSRVSKFLFKMFSWYGNPEVLWRLGQDGGVVQIKKCFLSVSFWLKICVFFASFCNECACSVSMPGPGPVAFLMVTSAVLSSGTLMFAPTCTRLLLTRGSFWREITCFFIPWTDEESAARVWRTERYIESGVHSILNLFALLMAFHRDFQTIPGYHLWVHSSSWFHMGLLLFKSFCDPEVNLPPAPKLKYCWWRATGFSSERGHVLRDRFREFLPKLCKIIGNKLEICSFSDMARYIPKEEWQLCPNRYFNFLFKKIKLRLTKKLPTPFTWSLTVLISYIIIVRLPKLSS